MVLLLSVRSGCRRALPSAPHSRFLGSRRGSALALPGQGVGLGVPPGFEKCGPPRKGQGVGVGGLLLWDAPTCLGL